MNLQQNRGKDIDGILKRYSERLCTQLSVDYDMVVGGGGAGTERKGYTQEVFWVRMLLIKRFRGEIKQKDIAKFLNVTENTAYHLHKRFGKAYHTKHKLREAIIYLDSIGFEGLVEKGMTPLELSKELDRHIDSLKLQQDKLSLLIDNTYRLKQKVVETISIER